MKTSTIIFSLFLLAFNANAYCSTYHSEGDTVYLIFDETYNESLPRNFRKSDGGFKRDYSSMPDTTGLYNLNISGSAEFSDKNIPLIKSSTGAKHLTVIDLRQEDHGFINGMPVSW